MPDNNSHCYEFGPYLFDVAQRVLMRAGEALSLTPKAAEILALLLSHAGQVVPKEELLKQVWPDTFVEEANLTQNIFLLRQVLGDERRPTPRYIETVVRRGYRFVSSVRLTARANEARHVSSETSLADSNGDAGPRVVAVLPFVNATNDPDVEYLADGLTDNIVNNLSRVSKLRVMSRSAVFRYKAKKEVDPRTIGRELGVGVVLVGKLNSRPSGIASGINTERGLLINVELVEVGRGWQLWGESFDCEINDILEIQDRITRQLLNALKLKLTGDEEKRITARYTENAAAYQSYLEGRYHWSKYTRKEIEKAIIHFRQAIELDPNYALAYAGIIDCYLRLATNYLPPEGDLRKPNDDRNNPDDNINNSVALAETGEDFNQFLGGVEARVKLRFEWDWKIAERELQRAHELKFDYPAAHQWYAAYRLAKQLFEQSGGCSESAVKDGGLPAQIVSGQPSTAEELQVLCAVAREQLAILNYEAAELVLKPWLPQNDWPKLGSLTSRAAADLLFTLGLLTAGLTTTRQTTNGYRRAAALLNGSIALFEHLNIKSRSVEARAELARCYYRQGLLDLARETLSAALSELPPEQSQIKCRCLVYWGMLERDCGRLQEAIGKLREVATLMGSAGALITIHYHIEIASTLRDLALSEQRDAYNEEAHLHYRLALYESEVIGDHRSTAIAENNLALFLLNLKAWEEAEKHLLHARRLLEALSDSFRVAQVSETLARLYIATCEYDLAHMTIERAIQTLELTDAEAILSEALTTSGIVACRLERFGDARKRFEEAYKVAERCGDREGARRALLSMFEEMNDRLDRDDLTQMLDKLTRLRSITEPSPHASRLEEIMSQIDASLNKTQIKGLKKSRQRSKK